MNFDELGFKGQRFNLSRQTDTHYALADFKLYFKKVKFQEILLDFKFQNSAYTTSVIPPTQSKFLLRPSFYARQ